MKDQEPSDNVSSESDFAVKRERLRRKFFTDNGYTQHAQDSSTRLEQLELFFAFKKCSGY